MPISVDEVIAIGKQKGVDMSKYESRLRQKYGQTGIQDTPEQTQQPQGMTQNSDINALIAQATKPKNIGNRIGDALSILGGGKAIEVDDGNDYQRLYAQEAIKKQFEDPTVRQLREAEITALNQPPPPGFVRVGKQTLADPNHVNPNEQVAIDREKRQYDKDMAEQQASAEAKSSQANLFKMQAQDIYNTVGEIEKGANFFGPIGGDLPTWAAPSSWLPGGQTPGQRTNWEANLDKLRASLSLEKINELRSAGKTGSTGMGILSDKDINLLTNAATALRRNLEPKDAMRYIKDIKDVQAKLLGIGGNTNLPGQVSQQPNNDLDAQVNSMLDQLGA